jgi:hypothetical protein
MTRNPLLAFLLVALVGLGTPFLVARQPAEANGVPQLVKLEYLEGLSNWGPEDAQGVLEFSFAESYARVDVKDLVPEPGYTYEGWLLNDNGNAFLVGEIAIAASGIGALETSLDGLDRHDYNLFFIAGRTEADAPGIPPSTLSIGGSFTVIANAADGTDAGDTRPQVLPDTGEAATQSPFSRGLMAMAAMTATGITIIFVSRLRRKGTTND